MRSILTKFEAYLLTEKRVSQNTFAAYHYDLEQVSDFFIVKNISFEHATPQDFKEFLQHLVDKKLSARSRARKLSALKSLYAWAAARLGWNNATIDLAFPKLEQTLPRYLTEQEIERLFSGAQHNTTALGIRNKTMLYMLYASGARISELIALKRSDIYFDTGFIRLGGKGGKERLVPLPDSMVILIRSYLETTHKNLVPHYPAENVEYLFPVIYRGVIKPITRQSFWIILKKLCKKAQLDRSVSPHTLRHSLATHLLKKGANLRSLQMLLGHETIATVQIYTHVETDHLRKVYDKKHPRA